MTGRETPQTTKRSAPTTRPRALAWVRSWRRHLLSENMRVALSLVLSLVPAVIFALTSPQLNVVLGSEVNRIWGLIIIMVVIVGMYSLLFAGLTVLALHGQSRERLLAVARLPHARKQVRLYRDFGARSSAAGEAMQVMLIAALAVAMLALRPQVVPLELLLVLTIGSVVAAWLSTVVTFALEYAAADAHGEGFDLPFTPAPERNLSEYLYAAVLVQTASGSTEMVPRTRRARTLIRSQAVLAYVMNTIIITVGVSVLVTAFS